MRHFEENGIDSKFSNQDFSTCYSKSSLPFDIHFRSKEGSLFRGVYPFFIDIFHFELDARRLHPFGNPVWHAKRNTHFFFSKSIKKNGIAVHTRKEET